MLTASVKSLMESTRTSPAWINACWSTPRLAYGTPLPTTTSFSSTPSSNCVTTVVTKCAVDSGNVARYGARCWSSFTQYSIFGRKSVSQ